MEKRESQILALFDQQEFWSVSDLAARLEVSAMTIRRDLNALEAKKLVRRHHGGAVVLHTISSEPFYKDRMRNFVEEKKVIAEVASTLIKSNQIIAIDSGSTCFELVKLIKDRNITIVTTNFHVISECLNSGNIKVIVPPGVLRPFEGSITGADTVAFLSKLHVDLFFMGVGGIDQKAGLTDYNLDDVAVKQVFIKNASKLVVLADKSKMNCTTFAQICSVESMDILVTDQRIPSGGLLDAMQRSGVRVITPNREEEDK